MFCTTANVRISSELFISKPINRVGLMFLIGTNLSNWLCLIIDEAEYALKEHSTSHAASPVAHLVVLGNSSATASSNSGESLRDFDTRCFTRLSICGGSGFNWIFCQMALTKYYGCQKWWNVQQVKPVAIKRRIGRAVRFQSYTANI